MAFKFHPPTRTTCSTCEQLEGTAEPIISTQRGKASAADSFPIHNWYNFVLGYTPEFPDFMIEKFNVGSDSLIVDPFSGSGTTLVCAKAKGIPGVAVEANDFFHEAANTKLEWKVPTKEIRTILESLRESYRKKFSRIDWATPPSTKKTPFDVFAAKHRPTMLEERYMSDHSFAQIQLLTLCLDEIQWKSPRVRAIFGLAISSILVPASNIRYGPGFGVSKRVRIVDVWELFEKKVTRMIGDLELAEIKANKSVQSRVILGDARIMSQYIDPSSVDVMITSPPYPGDHEYTKHSRIELILGDYARDLSEFRTIKKRMLRGSTTNIYKEDNEGAKIAGIASIREIVQEITFRLEHDGATSGFEKLYPKLILEYFGGMHSVFEEALKVLKPNSPFSLLVSDSHAFKMVHIKTAEILAEVAVLAGFTRYDIELWQFKKTTSHRYELFENILTVWK